MDVMKAEKIYWDKMDLVYLGVSSKEYKRRFGEFVRVPVDGFSDEFLNLDYFSDLNLSEARFLLGKKIHRVMSNGQFIYLFFDDGNFIEISNGAFELEVELGYTHLRKKNEAIPRQKETEG